jgi:spore maturation protein CgeB
VKFVLLYHSLVSDWNHGNAHFLRGIATELLDRGHTVSVYEPRDAWSVQNLVADHGTRPLEDFHRAYPNLRSMSYDLATLDLDHALDGADVVLVHEWNDHALVARIGEHRARARTYRLFFHDTHHRAVTQPETMAAYDLRHYDGVLAYGRIIRDLYLRNGWTQHAWTWHEAADMRVFHPRPHDAAQSDVIWIGNWGEDERTAELHEFLIEPIRDLRLEARVYGVRYPEGAVAALKDAKIEYAGWLANYRVPEAFSRYRFTVHVPRRPYVVSLPGIPTIRPFEALACAIPLISAPWDDVEELFTAGRDYLTARDGRDMRSKMRSLMHDRALAQSLAEHGLRTILRRHTCGHRVNELMNILLECGGRYAALPLTEGGGLAAALPK